MAIDVSTITSRSDAITTNLRVIATALRDHGLTQCSIEYSGYGDSGEFNDVVIEPENQTATLPSLTIVTCQSSYVGGAFHLQYTAEECAFNEAVSTMLDLLLDNGGHAGFENNEGGGGTLTITADGKIEYDHYDNVVEEVHATQEYSVTLEPDVPPAPIPMNATNPVEPFALGF